MRLTKLLRRLFQNTLGYNLAALKYLQRQHEANKVAEFYEKDVLGTGMSGGSGNMADEKDVRAMLEASAKKRKRATMQS